MTIVNASESKNEVRIADYLLNEVVGTNLSGVREYVATTNQKSLIKEKIELCNTISKYGSFMLNISLLEDCKESMLYWGIDLLKDSKKEWAMDMSESLKKCLQIVQQNAHMKLASM